MNLLLTNLTFTCSKSKTETLEKCVNMLYWIYFTHFSSVSIVKSEQVNLS